MGCSVDMKIIHIDLFQVPTVSVMVSSMLRLMIYCGVCDNNKSHHDDDDDFLCQLVAACKWAASEGGTTFIYLDLK